MGKTKQNFKSNNRNPTQAVSVPQSWAGVWGILQPSPALLGADVPTFLAFLSLGSPLPMATRRAHRSGVTWRNEKAKLALSITACKQGQAGEGRPGGEGAWAEGLQRGWDPESSPAPTTPVDTAWEGRCGRPHLWVRGNPARPSHQEAPG